MKIKPPVLPDDGARSDDSTATPYDGLGKQREHPIKFTCLATQKMLDDPDDDGYVEGHAPLISMPRDGNVRYIIRPVAVAAETLCTEAHSSYASQVVEKKHVDEDSDEDAGKC